jgi:hypothetical protein
VRLRRTENFLAAEDLPHGDVVDLIRKLKGTVDTRDLF